MLKLWVPPPHLLGSRLYIGNQISDKDGPILPQVVGGGPTLKMAWHHHHALPQNHRYRLEPLAGKHVFHVMRALTKACKSVVTISFLVISSMQ